MKSRWIFITGGVLSSLGKGIAAASIGALLKARGLSVQMVKMDPYLNVDTSTMSPSQHGEVFVLDDGTETDLDLGHYSRFAQVSLSKKNSITAGSVYWDVLHRERRGDYLGATIQTIPHITDEIKNRLQSFDGNSDVIIVELGGTVGDVESMPFLESMRQMIKTKKSIAVIHLVWVPWVASAAEIKTKPAQASVRTLMEHGIFPDIILSRSDRELSKEAREKLALFSNLEVDRIIEAPDVESVYEVPLTLHRNNLSKALEDTLGLPESLVDLGDWERYVSKLKTPTTVVNVAIVGKYSDVKDSYKSLYESIHHAATYHHIKADVTLVPAEDIEANGPEILRRYGGVIVAGGFGIRGFEGKVSAVGYCRTHNIPFLGICLGMQAAVVEYARNVAGLEKASSTEMHPDTPHPVICLMKDQEDLQDMGGTLRVGSYTCYLKEDTLIAKSYGSTVIHERHRHRWEFNPKYEELLSSYGLVLSGKEPNIGVVEAVELHNNHPWFVGVQFHPELTSVVPHAHPLFISFMSAVVGSYSDETDE